MRNDAPKPNVELLDRTLAEVRKAARRGLWDQNVWHVQEDCGTVMCFAGYAAELAGREWRAPDDWYVRPRVTDRVPRNAPGAWLYGSQPWLHVRVAAQNDLGLTASEADALFSHRNSLRDLSRIVREIKRRA